MWRVISSSAFSQLRTGEFRTKGEGWLHFWGEKEKWSFLPLFSTLRYPGAPLVCPSMDGNASFPGHCHRLASASWHSGSYCFHHPTPDLLCGPGAHLIPVGSIQRKHFSKAIPAFLQNPCTVWDGTGWWINAIAQQISGLKPVHVAKSIKWASPLLLKRIWPQLRGRQSCQSSAIWW